MKTNAFPKLTGKGIKIALVVARFNREVTKKLEVGARKALRAARVQPKDIAAHYVLGSFEIPLIAARIAEQKKVDAIICLGAIIKGETKHDEYVARAVAQGIMEVNIKYDVPTIFGVLTTDNFAQALARARPDKTNKGYEAAMSAIEIVHTLRKI